MSDTPKFTPNIQGKVEQINVMLQQQLAADELPVIEMCQMPEGGTPADCPLERCGCRVPEISGAHL
jgi:type VI secretion system secreted protein VgrG